MKRLQEKKPNYNVTRWAVEDNDRRRIVENICEYPYQLLSKSTEDAAALTPQGPADFIIKKKNRSHYPSAGPGSSSMYS